MKKTVCQTQFVYALIKEITDVISYEGAYVNYRHIALLCDIMTNRGYLMSIDRFGINRGNIGPLAKCSFEETTDQLFKAAIFGEVDKLLGVSSNIMMGQVPPCGTGESDIMIDEMKLLNIGAQTKPELDDIEEKDLDMSEIRVDTYRASGAGGQHVNKTDSAVRLTHEPSGIVVECQEDRSQHKNKAKALALLSAKIYDVEKQKIEQEKATERKSLVGTGDRSEKIRTYNFPQGRITDHRLKLTLYNIENFLDGDINEMLDSLKAQSNAEKLLEIQDS